MNAVHRTSLQPLRNLLLGVTSSIKGEARAGLSRGQFNSWARLAMLVIFLGITAKFALAADTGTISGTVSDPQGSVVPGVTVQLTAVETGVIQNVETDGAGFYRFPALPLGHYDITFSKAGFEKFETKGLLIDVDSALHADATLKVGSTSEQVTVTTTEAQVETESAQIGQVIGGKEMEDIPLDGRAYTDLLALQPGVVPFNASLFGVIGPQNGTLNAGALDISGGQETHNGYMVNGANVVEGYEGGTFLIPVLDSIAEFRIITADANAEYGNYSGGLVNVVTKSGTNQFHGDAFEFNRNTDYDADDYFAKSKGVYHQNQFGGTLGGPIWRNHLFAFGDWQKTHNTQGASSGNQYVPDTAELGGNFSDEATRMASSVTLGSGTSAVTEAVPSQVSGPNFASSLTSGLGYTVTNGEPYYFYAGEYLPGGTSGQYESSCTSTDQCVFPNATIPSGAIATLSPPAPNYIKLIPGQTVLTTPGNPGYFVSNAYPSTLDDDKGGVRIDADTKIGTVSGYYHVDPWKQLSPYAGWGGSTVPGFPSEAKGKAQLYVVGLTSRFGSSAVNVLSVNWTKNTNSSLNSPTDAGTTPQSFGFAAPTSDGIFTTAPGFVNIPGVSFNSFGLGPPNTVLSQNDNLYGIQDDFSKVIGVHTFKFGGAYHTDKYDVGHVDNASDGDFVFNGEETGIDFADFLIGAPSTFYEGTPSVLNLRNYYVGIYGQDTWRINSHLTANLGLRWDVDPFWEDTHNASPVVRYGVQSTQYPTAPAGYVFPGHDGIARRSGALTRFNNLGPRISLAYTPHVADGFLHSIFGDESKSSIRAGYGMYYTNVEGANTFNFSAPPTHLFYYQSIPVYFAQPFLNRDSGVDLGQRFPVPVVDPATINWAEYEPLSSFSSPLAKSKTPYEEHIDVSFERQLASNIVMDVTYVGTFGHHLIIAGDNNPGDPALCLSVSQPDETTDGITCGPGGEGGTYHPITGGTIDTTRGPYGPNFGNNQDELDIGNSAYNALEATLRRTGTRLSLLFAYTYSKSIDNGSGFGDQVFEYGNHNAFRSPSYYNLPQNFAASYTWEMPWDLLFKKNNQITRGWKLSGQTHFTDGTPVEILETDDRSLVGSSGLTFAGSTDEPDVQFGSGQSFYGDKNPRHGKAYINVSLYSQEPLGGQGNAPRRFLHGPGEDNWDAALLKDIKIHENISFELRGEFFNVFNHVQFYGGGIVNGNFANGLPSQGGSFGLVGGDAGARVGQVAGKLYF